MKDYIEHQRSKTLIVTGNAGAVQKLIVDGKDAIAAYEQFRDGKRGISEITAYTKSNYSWGWQGKYEAPVKTLVNLDNVLSISIQEPEVR